MKSNKKLIVIISIVVALAVASAVFAYLFLMTDIFKSNKELFSKYFSQNEQAFQKITELKTVEVYENLKNENKYESNTNIKMIHSEGGEISNPLNNLAVKLDVQKNNEEQYLYADGQILYEEEEYLEAEIIKEKETYGIRFTDAVKQFVSVRNDENLEAVMNNIGIDVYQLQETINKIDENQLAENSQQLDELKNKYLNIIINTITNGTFSKQKNAMITYNNVTTKTNAYSLVLSSEQVQNMLIEVLNNVKNENEILEQFQTVIDKESFVEEINETISWISEEVDVPSIKITVYEQKQQTIRTVIEIGVHKITIENIEQNGELKTKINYLDLNETKQIDVEISKKNSEAQETFEITINVGEGEENYTIILLNQTQFTDSQIEFDTEISYKQNITTISLILENKVSKGNSFERKQTLGADNNITLNDLEEKRQIELIDVLKRIVPETTSERIDLLMQKFGLENEENISQDDTTSEEQITQVEINKFNSKFEFYTGEQVSAENVKMLIDIVKNNLANYEIIDEELEEEKVNIKLNIEKEKINEADANEVLEKIKDRSKYKVQIFYKETNGLIDYIEITEI